jgi:DnaK suppressor protein
MTEHERAELTTLIQQRIAELGASVPYLEEESKAVEPSVSLGRLTRMEALNDKGVNEHILQQSRRTLEKLENALRRADSEEFGRCIRCGGEIPMGRLRLVPEALVCVPCAERKS